MGKRLPLFLIFFFTIVTVGAQKKSTLYKANQWLDIRGEGGFVKAYNNPKKEKAEVLLSIDIISVTLGITKYDYKLNSFYRFSAAQWRYVVTRGGKNYEIVISEHKPEQYSIGIDGEWIINQITDVSIFEEK